jgi:lipoprotein-anchoring transpeptidase ErfK/SrfK
MIETITISLLSFQLCAESPKAKRCYPVAVGKTSYPTPTGEFKVNRLIECPTFQNFKTNKRIKGCTSSNPLGKYFISFKESNGLSWGIHGTNSPSSIGKAISHGCIRMFNSDINQIFPYVNLNTKVIIQN